MTTNSPDPVRVEHSDRRFVIIEIDPDNKPNPETFAKLHSLLNEGAPLHFYRYLMSRNLSGFSPELHRPITDAAKDMMAGQTSSHLLFIQACIEREVIDVSSRPLGGTLVPYISQLEIPSADLYSAYTHWCGNSNPKYTPDGVRKFSKRLNQAGLLSGFKRGTAGVRKLKLLPPADVKKALVLKNCWMDM